MAPVETQRTRTNNSVNLIGDDNVRKLSFQKRKSTLKKKAAQLSTLCDVNVCMVCFGPDGTVETWPENKSDLLDLICKYKGLSENAKVKGKQKQNLLEFLGDKKRKLDEKLNNKERPKRKKLTRTDVGRAFSSWDEKLNLFSEEKLVSLSGSLDNKLQVLGERIKLIKQEMNEKAVVIDNKEASNNSTDTLYQVCQSSPPTLGLVQFNNGDCSLNEQQPFSGSDIDLGKPEDFGFSGENYGNNYMGINVNNNLDNDLLQGFVRGNRVLTREASCGFAGEDNSLNNYFCSDGWMNSQVCQSNPPTVGLVQFNNGDCSLYRQQPFSGSDIDLGKPENFRFLGENYGNDFMGNVNNSDVAIDNGLLQGFVHENNVLTRDASYGFAGEGNSLNNYFCSDGWMNNYFCSDGWMNS